MNAIRGVKNERGYNRANWFEAGIYPRVEITRIGVREAQSGTFFYVEGKILESTVATRPPGTVCEWSVGVPGEFKMGLRNMNSFFSVLQNAVEDDEELLEAMKIRAGQDFTDDDFIASSIHDDSKSRGQQSPTCDRFEGFELALSCVAKPKKNSEGDFTHHNWSPVRE